MNRLSKVTVLSVSALLVGAALGNTFAQTNAERLMAWQKEYQERMKIEAWANGQGDLPATYQGKNIKTINAEQADSILAAQEKQSPEVAKYGDLSVKIPRVYYHKMTGKITKGKKEDNGKFLGGCKWEAGDVGKGLWMRAFQSKDDDRFFFCYVFAKRPENPDSSDLYEFFEAVKGKTALDKYGEDNKVIQKDDFVVQGKYRQYYKSGAIRIFGNFEFGYPKDNVWVFNDDFKVNRLVSGTYTQGVRVSYPDESELATMEAKAKDY